MAATKAPGKGWTHSGPLSERSPSMTRCARCDHDNPPEDHFCGNCGAALSGMRPSAPRAVSPGLDAQVRGLLDEGRKIEAIKVFREETGAGLREAKEAVEAIERGLPPASTASIGEA